MLLLVFIFVAKLISFNEDKPLTKKQISRRITPSDLVDPKNDKLVKKTKVKGSGYVKRLSAGAYYRKHKHSDKIMGHICKIREIDTTLRCLLKRSNGTVYWAKKSKSGKGQEQCCLLYTSPSPRDLSTSRMPSSA